MKRMRSAFVGLTLLLPATRALWAQDGTKAEWTLIRNCRKLQEEGQIVQALSTLKRLSESRDVDVHQEALFMLGLAYDAAGRTKDAQAAWERLAAERPSPSLQRKTYVCLGDQYRASGQIEKAIRAYTEVVSAGEGEPTAEKVRAAEALGDLYAGRNSPDRAIEMYHFALTVAAGMYDDERKKLNLDAIRKKLAGLEHPAESVKKPDARVIFEEAEALRQAGRFADALAKYREVISRFSESPEAHPSGLHVGMCLVALLRYQEAEKHWNDFTRTVPDGPYRGHALVGLADVHLEFYLDPKKAFDDLEKYFKGLEAGHTTWSEAEGDAQFRRAAVAYIEGNAKAAAAAIELAQRFRPAPAVYAENKVPTPLEMLIDNLRQGKELTPALARQGGSGQARTAVVLGDLYLAARELKKAQALYGRLNGPAASLHARDLAPATQPGASPNDRVETLTPQRASDRYCEATRSRDHGRETMPFPATDLQKAWARLGEGKSRCFQFDFEGALGCFGEFTSRYEDQPWAAEALLCAAVIAVQMAPEGGVLEEGLYNRILAKYPTSRQAPDAAYFRAVAAYDDGKADQALQRFQDMVQRYPSPRTRELARYWADVINKESGKLHQLKGDKHE